MKTFFPFLLVLIVILFATSCQRNKVTCPTYAYSFPEKKPKKQSNAKLSPNKFKATSKPQSGVLPK